GTVEIYIWKANTLILYSHEFRKTKTLQFYSVDHMKTLNFTLNE
ncbi:unnamed protein product, partial [Urochloa humidicola]